jgi:phosphomevalonate kinase
MITAQAPGKMILLGEYAVLNGAPALVCAVDRLAKVHLQANPKNEFQLNSPALGIPAQPFVVTPSGKVRFDPQLDKAIAVRLTFFQTIFEKYWEYFKNHDRRIPALQISLDTMAFYSDRLQSKLGFGSSAAMTVALMRALCQIGGSDERYSPDNLFGQSLQAHRLAQGNLGSGIDVAASVYGGALIYEMSRADSLQKIPQPVEVWQELLILPVWTGRSASTRSMVRGVDRLKESDAALYGELMNRLAHCSQQGCRAYMQKDFTAFFEAVKEFYQTLSQLGKKSAMPIISPAHQKLANIAESVGTVYKPSGAGSGDIGVAFSDSAEKIGLLKQAVQQAGFEALDVRICRRGVGLI